MTTLAHIAAAFRLLTRLPLPADHNHHQATAAASWFPLVGVAIGLLLLAVSSLPTSATILALLITLLWMAVTGGLHLDGAADLADGLGAAHGEISRLLAVMKDPHIGSFGALALIAITATKLMTLQTLFTSESPPYWALLLIPAWARFEALCWMHTLRPLSSGLGEHYRQPDATTAMAIWSCLLIAATLWLLPTEITITALLFLLGWYLFLRHHLKGMNGDCLGAGIEYCECAMLLALVV